MENRGEETREEWRGERSATSTAVLDPQPSDSTLSGPLPNTPVPPRRCLVLANTRAGALSRLQFFRDFPYSLVHILRRTPHAHKDELPVSLSVLAQAAAEAGLTADVEPVPPPDALPERLRAAVVSGYNTVIAVGGDGTVRTVANGILRAHVSLPLGILPLGTANNVARSLGLPFALADALAVVAAGHTRRVDAGRIGEEYFLEAAGVGLLADAVQGFGAHEPHRHEIVRIARVALPLLWSLKTRNLALTLDGRTETEEALIVTISNGAYLGEGVAFAPEASLSDGLFDVVIVGVLKRVELLGFLWALLRAQHLELPQVRRVRARTVEIRRVHRSHQPLPIHADDYIAGYTPARLETVPDALCVFVPPPNQVD